MQKPLTVLCIHLFRFIIRFITAAGQLFPRFKFHGKSKLLRFCGMDIKKCHRFPYDLSFFSILYHNHMKPFS